MGNETRRRLLSDTPNAGNIVGAITGQCQNIDHLLRPNAKAQLNALAVDTEIFHAVPNGNAVVDQLHEILVATDDNHRVALGLKMLGGSSHEVIGFKTWLFNNGNIEITNQALNPVDLHHQVLRRCLAVGLVRRIEGVSEIGLRTVKKHRKRRNRPDK